MQKAVRVAKKLFGRQKRTRNPRWKGNNLNVFVRQTETEAVNMRFETEVWLFIDGMKLLQKSSLLHSKGRSDRLRIRILRVLTALGINFLHHPNHPNPEYSRLVILLDVDNYL